MLSLNIYSWFVKISITNIYCGKEWMILELFVHIFKQLFLLDFRRIL